jgi:hypothetical protein
MLVWAHILELDISNTLLLCIMMPDYIIPKKRKSANGSCELLSMLPEFILAAS